MTRNLITMCNLLAFKILTAVSLANTIKVTASVVEPEKHKQQQRSTAGSCTSFADDQPRIDASGNTNAAPDEDFDLLLACEPGNTADVTALSTTQQEAHANGGYFSNFSKYLRAHEELESCELGVKPCSTTEIPRPPAFEFDLASSLQDEGNPFQHYLLQGFLRTRREFAKLTRVSKKTRAALQLAESSLRKNGQKVYEPFRSVPELEEVMQLWWTDEYRNERRGLDNDDDDDDEDNLNTKEQYYEDLRYAAEAKYGPVEQWDVGQLDRLPEFCFLEKEACAKLFFGEGGESRSVAVD
ncbi:unnamed protein product [Amoebophrya sp. A120]|nr:unnamed protein product [Amoebophrya sp. A120]|eukprot:GSA120T00022045001.1